MSWIEQRKKAACWVACWKDKGKKIRKSTGIPIAGGAGMTPKQSKALAERTAEAMELAAKGNAPLERALAMVRACALSAGDCSMPSIKEYLMNYQGTGNASTIKRKKAIVSRFLAWLGPLADKRLDALTSPICRDFFRAQLKEVRSGTVRLYKNDLSSILNRAVEDGVIPRNPIPRMELAKEAAALGVDMAHDSIHREAFSLGEIKLMALQFPAPWCDAVRLAYYTNGQRLGDICCLRWENVDWQAGEISMTTRKVKKVIVPEMPPSLVARLRDIQAKQHAGEEYIFPRLAHAYLGSGKGSLSSEFTGLLRAWGIVPPKGESPQKLGGRRKEVSRKSFHSIRHTIVSNLRASGAFSPDVICAAVGQSEEVQRQYFHGTKEQRKAIADYLDRALEGAILP